MLSKGYTGLTIDSTTSKGSLRAKLASLPSLPRSIRRIGSTQVTLGLLLNILITICPLYFIVFAVLAYRNTGTPLALPMNQSLLEASIYGPTIFPVVFAAVVGRFLKSVADWNLQRGTTLATIEYLLASRTVSGVLTAPIRFRVFRFLILPLIMLWAFSPLGSQASFRLIESATAYRNSTKIITYMDTNTSLPLTQGASGAQTYAPAVNAAFNAALFGAANAKDASQDLYGHVKIPMLESVQSLAGATPNGQGWYNIPTQAYNLSMYSSLTGLPCLGTIDGANIHFAAETSYFSTDCSAAAISNQTSNDFFSTWSKYNKYSSGASWNGGQLGITFDLGHYNETTRPRNVTIYSLNTSIRQISVISCKLTTTFVEVQIGCWSGNCNVTAIRNSTLPNQLRNWSIMDEVQLAMPNLFNGFVNASSTPHVASSGPIELYLDNPRTPIISTREVTLSSVGATAISRRFAQLLNSYWMVTLSPDAALGKDFTIDIAPTTGSKNILGEVVYEQEILLCNKAWVGVLLLASLAMLTAGILTTVLDAYRKGPDIIDVFVSTLRDNPYARFEDHSSLENGSDAVRRLRDLKVYVGDVQPLSTYGYVAIAAPDMSMEVESLSHDRLYR